MNYALKWELHKPSNEFLTFIKMNIAGNYAEYREAIKGFSCPVQNFTFAGKNNDIAVSHQGSIPVKEPGQGKFILDGTISSALYTRHIPPDSLPQVINPSSGYVVSANQHPTFANYSYYYNGYYSVTRANRINQMLEKENAFDIMKMKAMQVDNHNFFAADALPFLVQSINSAMLNPDQQKILAGISTWEAAYNFNDEYARLFEMWWTNIEHYTWDEFKEYSFYTRFPEDYILLDLMQQEPGNRYFDKRGTSAKENANDIIREAFIIAAGEYGKLKKEGDVRWGLYNRVNVMHMTNIVAFSKTNLPSAGHPETINATSGSWGPSWRMIVELGDRPKAFGIYGGGQSGNLASPYFDNFVNDWNKGTYYPLTFYMSREEAKQHTSTAWVLN